MGPRGDTAVWHTELLPEMPYSVRLLRFGFVSRGCDIGDWRGPQLACKALANSHRLNFFALSSSWQTNGKTQPLSARRPGTNPWAAPSSCSGAQHS